MKQLIILLGLIGLLFSCNIEDDSSADTGLVGDWKLIEVLTDPGDGSGTFLAVESNKIISFYQNGTVTSNGTICNTSIEANNPTSGTYSLTNSTFNSQDCYNPEFEYQFEQDGNILIVIYPCIEPCLAKYKKI